MWGCRCRCKGSINRMTDSSRLHPSRLLTRIFWGISRLGSYETTRCVWLSHIVAVFSSYTVVSLFAVICQQIAILSQNRQRAQLMGQPQQHQNTLAMAASQTRTGGMVGRQGQGLNVMESSSLPQFQQQQIQQQQLQNLMNQQQRSSASSQQLLQVSARLYYPSTVLGLRQLTFLHLLRIACSRVSASTDRRTQIAAIVTRRVRW